MLFVSIRKLNENSSRRYQFYDKRIKHLLRKIHADSRDKPDKNSGEVREDPDLFRVVLTIALNTKLTLSKLLLNVFQLDTAVHFTLKLPKHFIKVSNHVILS